jgi:hypothetical protein
LQRQRDYRIGPHVRMESIEISAAIFVGKDTRLQAGGPRSVLSPSTPIYIPLQRKPLLPILAIHIHLLTRSEHSCPLRSQQRPVLNVFRAQKFIKIVRCTCQLLGCEGQTSLGNRREAHILSRENNGSSRMGDVGFDIALQRAIRSKRARRRSSGWVEERRRQGKRIRT